MPSLKHLKQTKLILIGASTGGPGHIKKILASLPSNFSASIVIAQHMGDDYIPSFIKQLNSSCKLKVIGIQHEALLLPSHVYVSSLLSQIKLQDKHLIFTKCSSSENEYNPDINKLFISASKLADSVSILGIILTGIGEDGAIGCKLLSTAGAECIAESETSAIVYGMPMQALKMNKNTKVMTLEQVIQRINVFGEKDV